MFLVWCSSYEVFLPSLDPGVGVGRRRDVLVLSVFVLFMFNFYPYSRDAYLRLISRWFWISGGTFTRDAIVVSGPDYTLFRRRQMESYLFESKWIPLVTKCEICVTRHSHCWCLVTKCEICVTWHSHCWCLVALDQVALERVTLEQVALERVTLEQVTLERVTKLDIHLSMLTVPKVSLVVTASPGTRPNSLNGQVYKQLTLRLFVQWILSSETMKFRALKLSRHTLPLEMFKFCTLLSQINQLSAYLVVICIQTIKNCLNYIGKVCVCLYR